MFGFRQYEFEFTLTSYCLQLVAEYVCVNKVSLFLIVYTHTETLYWTACLDLKHNYAPDQKSSFTWITLLQLSFQVTNTRYCHFHVHYMQLHALIFGFESGRWLTIQYFQFFLLQSRKVLYVFMSLFLLFGSLIVSYAPSRLLKDSFMKRTPPKHWTKLYLISVLIVVVLELLPI